MVHAGNALGQHARIPSALQGCNRNSLHQFAEHFRSELQHRDPLPLWASVSHGWALAFLLRQLRLTWAAGLRAPEAGWNPRPRRGPLGFWVLAHAGGQQGVLRSFLGAQFAHPGAHLYGRCPSTGISVPFAIADLRQNPEYHAVFLERRAREVGMGAS